MDDPENHSPRAPNQRIAISPCPNDTFAFYSLIESRKYTVDFLDIEELNRALLSEEYDIAKGSFAIMEKLAPKYEVLSVGAAIGKGIGPVFVGTLKDGARIALPGENTTAHKLFQFWRKFHPEINLTVLQMPFFEMLPALTKGEIAAAVLIHEGRFVYPSMGLQLISDLGAFWEEQTGAMIPLGCIYAKRTLSPKIRAAFVADLTESLKISRREYQGQSALYLNAVLPYMRERAQEKDDKVVEAHVSTYVTSDTIAIGKAALDSLQVFRERCLL